MTISPVTAELIPAGRLDLVPLRPRHADDMAGVLAAPALYTFTGGTPPTAEALWARYERWTAGSGDPGISWCNWTIRLCDPGCLAGGVQATVSAVSMAVEPSAEVAWVVGVPWQGRGIATEAARALVAWLRSKPIRVITAHIHPDHTASAAVARAAGLVSTGVLEDGGVRWTSRASPAAER